MIKYMKYSEVLKKVKTSIFMDELEKCPDMIEKLVNEKKENNKYILLAESFSKYNDPKYIVTQKDKDSVDYCFYEFLKNIIEKGENLIIDGIEIPLKYALEPYVIVSHEDKYLEVIHPRWHLFIAYLAYLEAVDRNPKWKQKEGCPKSKFAIRCKSLLYWINL